MAVFRIEKTRDYTVMSNHHLRNAGLSLKSKGLLSMMLSLPEDWNYTTRGLAKICKEGTDSIGSALKELERAGYIVRNRLRDSKGKMDGQNESSKTIAVSGAVTGATCTEKTFEAGKTYDLVLTSSTKSCLLYTSRCV